MDLFETANGLLQLMQMRGKGLATRSHNTLPQHAPTTRSYNTLPHYTTTIRSYNTLSQYAPTTRFHNMPPKHSRTYCFRFHICHFTLRRHTVTESYWHVPAMYLTYTVYALVALKIKKYIYDPIKIKKL